MNVAGCRRLRQVSCLLLGVELVCDLDRLDSGKSVVSGAYVPLAVVYSTVQAGTSLSVLVLVLGQVPGIDSLLAFA